jgi:predicted HicB family RNase H-like nuclease
MQKRIQIVGRLPVALSRRVRAVATQRQISLNTLLIEALTQALGGSRRVTKQEAR